MPDAVHHVRLHGAPAPTAPLLETGSNTAPGSLGCFEVTEAENEINDEARSRELQATAYVKTMPSLAFMTDQFKFSGKKHPKVGEDEKEVGKPDMTDGDLVNTD